MRRIRMESALLKERLFSIVDFPDVPKAIRPYVTILSGKLPAPFITAEEFFLYGWRIAVSLAAQKRGMIPSEALGGGDAAYLVLGWASYAPLPDAYGDWPAVRLLLLSSALPFLARKIRCPKRFVKRVEGCIASLEAGKDIAI
jgi:hypothetical protein